MNYTVDLPFPENSILKIVTLTEHLLFIFTKHTTEAEYNDGFNQQTLFHFFHQTPIRWPEKETQPMKVRECLSKSIADKAAWV